MPKILWQQTTIQSTNGAASSSSVATISVGGVKSLNAASKQTQTSKKLWQIFIGLGVGYFAVVTAALNLPNSKSPVSVSPQENAPLAIPSSVPSPVTKVDETPTNAQPQPTISPLTLPTSDTLEIEQAQREAIEKEKNQAALKVEQERQAAIKKEAATAEREQLEAVIREKEHQDALVAQKRQQADKDRQTKIELEKTQALTVTSEFDNQASLYMGQNLPISAQATFPKGSKIKLEVARTQEQQMMGLMYRPALPDNRGMLFVFPSTQPAVRFWMKNTPVSLDILFLHNGVIKYIETAAPPCNSEPCPTYYSPYVPIDQVIELRSGRAKELGLQIGDNVKIEIN